jgi:hypothetical protein
LSSEEPDDPEDLSEEIQNLMAELPSWEAKGDQQTMDYFRVYSVDFPHVDGRLTDDNSVDLKLANRSPSLSHFRHYLKKRRLPYRTSRNQRSSKAGSTMVTKLWSLSYKHVSRETRK